MICLGLASVSKISAMYVFKEVSHFFLKNYSYWTKGFYVQLRDAFFHLSIAINCYLFTRADLPDVRLTFLNGRDWAGAKETLLIEPQEQYLSLQGQTPHFWNAEVKCFIGIQDGVEEVFLWNLLVAVGDSQSSKTGGDGLVEDSDLRDYLMVVTCLVSFTPEFWFAGICSSLLLPHL